MCQRQYMEGRDGGPLALPVSGFACDTSDQVLRHGVTGVQPGLGL